MNKESRNSVLALALPLLPLLLLIAGAVFLINCLFGSKEKKATEMSGIPGNSGEIIGIPAISAPKLTASVPLLVPATESVNSIEPEHKRHGVKREDLEEVFQDGPLTRIQAVTALKRMGIGKTVAYEALLAEGRFAFLLHFAPDGIISWREGFTGND